MVDTHSNPIQHSSDPTQLPIAVRSSDARRKCTLSFCVGRTKSPAISASGCKTKSLENMRGCGKIKPGSRTSRWPKNKTSKSIVRGPPCPSTARFLPRDCSMRMHAASNSCGVSEQLPVITALRKCPPARSPTAIVSYTELARTCVSTP